MDSSGAERALSLALPLPLCPGGVKAGGLPQYLPLGWVDKGGGLPANLRLMANKCCGSQEPSNLCGCCKKPTYQFLTAWWSEVVTWKENGLQIPDGMIVGNVSLSWKLCGCCHFRTSNSWLYDCQKLEFERKSNVHFLTAWLSETWTWMKTEHQIPDRMLVRNLVLAWNWSSISWLDIHENNSGAYWIPRDDLVSSSMLGITASHEMYDMSNR